MELDSHLADDCRHVPGRSFFAREVSEGASFVFDPAVGVAFLGGLRGVRLASALTPHLDILTAVVGREALILQSAFRKISRVGSLSGATKWYLSDDCLLAAKRVMYTVEYRRFYLRDLESITVWPSRVWILRPIIPLVLFVALGNLLWSTVNFTTGAIFAGLGLAWAALELVLGPTAKSRIKTTGAMVDLPLVPRTRRARKVLAKIDAAVRAARAGVTELPFAPVDGPQSPKPSSETSSESAPAPAPIGDFT